MRNADLIAFLGKSILIATDESLIAAMVAGELRTLGFAEVRTETTLAGALAAIDDITPGSWIEIVMWWMK